MPTNWSRRYKNHSEKLRSGDIYQVAEVVRNLSIRDKDKGLSAGEKRMLQRARQILDNLRGSTRAAAQMVSSFPIRASVSLVASSTMSIRQPRGPRSSNQWWKLPSNCTNSPKCGLRSLRWHCFLRLRCRLHSPASNIQRRRVS